MRHSNYRILEAGSLSGLAAEVESVLSTVDAEAYMPVCIGGPFWAAPFWCQVVVDQVPSQCR